MGATPTAPPYKENVMYEYKAKVVRWIDGDTVALQVDLGFRINKEEFHASTRIV